MMFHICLLSQHRSYQMLKNTYTFNLHIVLVSLFPKMLAYKRKNKLKGERDLVIWNQCSALLGLKTSSLRVYGGAAGDFMLMLYSSDETHVSNHHTLPHRSSIVGLLATFSSSIEAHCSRIRSTTGPTVAPSLWPSSGQGTRLSRRKVLVKSAPGNTLFYMPRLQKLNCVFMSNVLFYLVFCLCTSVVHDAQ